MYLFVCNVGLRTHCLVVGPGDQFIYMQWKRTKELEEGIKQKGKETKRGNSRELWRKPSGTNKFLYCSQGQTGPIYCLDGSMCTCVCGLFASILSDFQKRHLHLRPTVLVSDFEK